MPDNMDRVGVMAEVATAAAVRPKIRLYDVHRNAFPFALPFLPVESDIRRFRVRHLHKN